MVLGIAWFGLGAGITRYYDIHRLPSQAAQPSTETRVALDKNEVEAPPINFETQPLWAYGFERTPLPGEKARPQNPPNRNLRPDEDPGEQQRPRNLAGSSASYSLVDIRDGQNVIDWFPHDHPPMPTVVAHGPSALG